MNRVIKNLQKNSGLKPSQLMVKNRNNSQVLYFSSSQTVQTEENEIPYDKKVEAFERFSNSYYSLDRLKEILEYQKKLSEKKYNRDVIEDQLVSGLKEQYGKNYEKILNKKFTFEINGHKDGVAEGELDLYPKNLLNQNKFINYTKNGDLVNELQQSTYISVIQSDIHKNVVPENSHFSLQLDEHIPDEYVSELADNQVCIFGFPKTCDESDIQSLLKDTFKANFKSIEIGECVLSLPAYSILTFATKQEAQDFKRQVNSSNHLMDGRHIYATTFEDSRQEHSFNRSLLVSGFRETEGLNDLLNFLSKFGSVMHFEMIEHPVHQKLPSTEQVLNHLKSIVKEGDDSVVYEITDISQGTPIIVEYPPYNPNIQITRDGKKLSDIIDQIEMDKERQTLLAKRQLIPRIVLHTWDADSQAPEEYQNKNNTPEQNKIIFEIERKLREDYTNGQYLFITYACLEQTKMAHHALNGTGFYESTLKKSSEHYHCDTNHQTSVFKQIKQIKGDEKFKLQEQSIVAFEQENMLSQTPEEMRDALLDYANGKEFSQELSKLLENEVIGKQKHGLDHQLHLKSNKPGREFSTKVTKNDLSQLSTQIQDRQKQNMERLEDLSKNEDEIIRRYRAKVMNIDINKVTHPYVHVEPKEKEEIGKQLQEQANMQYKQKQEEYLKEEELIEKKFSDRDRPRKKRTFQKDDDEVPEIKEKEEDNERDQYYAPLNDYTLNKKKIKYNRYVGEMQRLYEGDYSEAMKERIFKNGGEECTDIDGNIFVSKEQGEQYDRYLISDEQFEMLKYYLSVADVMPQKKIIELYNQVIDSPDETLYMINQTKLPTKVFDRSSLPELDEPQLKNEDLVVELNKYAAGLGQKYDVQKDARGDEKIVLYEDTPHAVPLKALATDEIQLLRDCLTSYGFSHEDTEKEIKYFLKHGDYSEEVIKIVGSDETIEEDSELESLINATGLSKAGKHIFQRNYLIKLELESILNLDVVKEGPNILESLQEQRNEVSFDIKMGTAQVKDLIKTNTTLKNKDKQGKYKESTFKFF